MLGRRQEWQAIAATAKPDTASDTANGSSEGTDGSVLMVCSGLYRKRTPLQEKKKKKKSGSNRGEHTKTQLPAT